MTSLVASASSGIGRESNSRLAADPGNRQEARKVLRRKTSNDDSEIQYLLEYYSLVREGKTNYVSTTSFHDVTGDRPQEPPDFFKVYEDEFRPKSAKRRKVDGK